MRQHRHFKIRYRPFDIWGDRAYRCTIVAKTDVSVKFQAQGVSRKMALDKAYGRYKRWYERQQERAHVAQEASDAPQGTTVSFNDGVLSWARQSGRNSYASAMRYFYANSTPYGTNTDEWHLSVSDTLVELNEGETDESTQTDS